MELFTEQEIKDAKDRILQRAEERLTYEVLDTWRKSIHRDVSRSILDDASIQLRAAIKSRITDERIDNAIADALRRNAPGTYSGESFLEKEVRNGIQRVINTHAEAVSKEIKNLLYLALKADFFEKKGE